MDGTRLIDFSKGLLENESGQGTTEYAILVGVTIMVLFAIYERQLFRRSEGRNHAIREESGYLLPHKPR